MKEELTGLYLEYFKREDVYLRNTASQIEKELSDPKEKLAKLEVELVEAKKILESLGLRKFGPEVISCPTCGRCAIDLVEVVERVESAMLTKTKPVHLAIMGCVVNGPGEAREADFGIAGGKGVGLVFRKGKIVRKVQEAELADALMEEIRKTDDG